MLTIEKKLKRNLLFCALTIILNFLQVVNLKQISSILLKLNIKQIFSQIERIKAHSINLVDIGSALKNKLDDIKYNFIDKVIIENQIGPIANRMKCLQAMITQYFIDNGITDIEYISASNKLASFMSGPSEYKDRKNILLPLRAL